MFAPARSGLAGMTDSPSIELGAIASAASASPVEDVVDARAQVLGEAEADGRVGLGVDVDEERRVAGLRDAGGDVDRGRRLPHAALLVRDGVDGSHRPPT